MRRGDRSVSRLSPSTTHGLYVLTEACRPDQIRHESSLQVEEVMKAASKAAWLPLLPSTGLRIRVDCSVVGRDAYLEWEGDRVLYHVTLLRSALGLLTSRTELSKSAGPIWGR